MILVYLIGRHGIGKYTTCLEFAKYGYKICDNQLINNTIFSLLDFNEFEKIPDHVWETIAKVRGVVFDFVTNNPNKNYVLTNCLYDIEYDYGIYNQVLEISKKQKSLFVPVKLVINSRDEHLKRIQNPERKLLYKSTKISDVDENLELIKIFHTNLLELDITNLQPNEVYEKIQNWITILKEKYE